MNRVKKLAIALIFAVTLMAAQTSITGTVVAVSGRYLVLNVNGETLTVVLPQSMVLKTNVSKALAPGTNVTIVGTSNPYGVILAKEVIVGNLTYTPGGVKVMKMNMTRNMTKAMHQYRINATGNGTMAMNQSRAMTQAMNQTRSMVMTRTMTNTMPMPMTTREVTISIPQPTKTAPPMGGGKGKK
ncbi:hypothetical protein IPA_02870 [Ignicoccus pacificus DSM 13166]|uniref:DUF5666 domain-containing protein n=1 Tax=Ignicoccus pacificus DSM 13166 TaxID=940294 RepID=A0A977PJY5_9CREN|nr:hypothetical protein IPA_02870 [Ignicoccus pacificus DSM 13166]